MAIKKDTLDGLLAGRDPQAVFTKDGLFDELKKALAERVLNAEIDDHLDGEAAEGRRNLRIPTQSGQGFRFDVGHRSDLIPATIPK